MGSRLRILWVLDRTAVSLFRTAPAIAVWAVLLLVFPSFGAQVVLTTFKTYWAANAAMVVLFGLFQLFLIAVRAAVAEDLNGRRLTIGGGLDAIGANLKACLGLGLIYGFAFLFTLLALGLVRLIGFAAKESGVIIDPAVLAGLSVLALAPRVWLNSSWLPVLPALIDEKLGVSAALARAAELSARAPWTLLSLAAAQIAMESSANALGNKATTLMHELPGWPSLALWLATDTFGAALSVAVFFALRELPAPKPAPTSQLAAMAAP
jgi:hypothetical protein